MEKKITSRITIGVIIAGILILLDIISQRIYTPVPDGIPVTPKVIIVFAAVLAACILFSKQSGGNPGFAELFTHGFRTTAVIAFIMAAYTFIAVKFIYPVPSAAEMEAAVKAIELQGQALHQEAVQQAEAGAKNRWIIYVSISIFASLIPGLLGALCGAAIAKNTKTRS